MSEKEKFSLVDVESLAAILGVPKSWIYQRTCRGQAAIPHIKLGKYVRFNVEEVLRFLSKQQANKKGE